MIHPLHITFDDQQIVVEPDVGLTFGRKADLVVDDNPYLHRNLGGFKARGEVWWLMNNGTAIVMELSDKSSPSKLSLGPGTATPIPFVESVLRFQAGAANYELELVAASALESPSSFDGPELSAESTIAAKAVPLNDEQRLLLVALAERRLRDRSAPVSELPTNREVATMLGWSTTKFNRKLDNLCEKFERLGVTGLKGDLGELAKGRRERLVDHVLTVRLIDEDDLAALNEARQ